MPATEVPRERLSISSKVWVRISAVGCESFGRLLLADRENGLLRLIEHLLHRQALVKPQLDHLVAGADQLASQELVHHQPRHLLDGGG